MDVFQNQTAAAASGFPRFPYTYPTRAEAVRAMYAKTTLYRLTGAVMRWRCMFIRRLRPHTRTQSITYTQIRTHTHVQIYFYPAAHRFIDTPRRHRRAHILPTARPLLRQDRATVPPRSAAARTAAQRYAGGVPAGTRGDDTDNATSARDDATLRWRGEGAAAPRFFFSSAARTRWNAGWRARPPLYRITIAAAGMGS